MSMSAARFLSQPAIPAAAGFAFCLWNALAPDTVPCGASGCALYAGAGSAVVWALGALSFGLTFLLAKRKKKRWTAKLACLLLACDIPFLAVLVLTAPCTKCMLVGLLLFWMAMASRKDAGTEEEQGGQLVPEPLFRTVRTVWLALFCAVCGSLVGEAMAPRAVQGDLASAEATICISPSCPHCLEAVRRYEQSGRVAFIAVAPGKDDLARVVLMHSLRQENPSRSLSSIMEEVSRPETALPGAFEFALNAPLAFKTLAATAKAGWTGAKSLPLVEFRGLPAAK